MRRVQKKIISFFIVLVLIFLFFYYVSYIKGFGPNPTYPTPVAGFPSVIKGLSGVGLGSKPYTNPTPTLHPGKDCSLFEEDFTC